MAVLKTKDLRKTDKKLRQEKLMDLEIELIKANVRANKTNAKNKEIKRAIARIITISRLEAKSASGKKLKDK